MDLKKKLYYHFGTVSDVRTTKHLGLTFVLFSVFIQQHNINIIITMTSHVLQTLVNSCEVQQRRLGHLTGVVKQMEGLCDATPHMERLADVSHRTYTVRAKAGDQVRAGYTECVIHVLKCRTYDRKIVRNCQNLLVLVKNIITLNYVQAVVFNFYNMKWSLAILDFVFIPYTTSLKKNNETTSYKHIKKKTQVN